MKMKGMRGLRVRIYDSRFRVSGYMVHWFRSSAEKYLNITDFLLSEVRV